MECERRKYKDTIISNNSCDTGKIILIQDSSSKLLSYPVRSSRKLSRIGSKLNLMEDNIVEENNEEVNLF